ncbi:cyclin-A2 [Fukomys damarensis]|uniref:cyclin-A2 n=1 Tax=Fukomys damarensis TaxID=885580 RepID=UPI00053F8ECC|nr:cyclin-A2 [Fukomys damarensis]
MLTVRKCFVKKQLSGQIFDSLPLVYVSSVSDDLCTLLNPNNRIPRSQYYSQLAASSEFRLQEMPQVSPCGEIQDCPVAQFKVERRWAPPPPPLRSAQAFFLPPRFCDSAPRPCSDPSRAAFPRPQPCRIIDVKDRVGSHWSISIVAGYLNCKNSHGTGGLLATSLGVLFPSPPAVSTSIRGHLLDPARARAGNPDKAVPVHQPRAQAGLAVLKSGNPRCSAPQQRLKTRRVAPLKDLPVNDENVATLPPWKANSKQPAFTIHVDEAEDDTQKRPSESKKPECEDVLAFNTAVALPGPRKPLVPLDYPMDGSFDSPHTMDMSIVLEEEKPVSVNEVPDYHEDIHTYLREMEVKCKPKVGYMKKQPDITNSMRAILVDWLVEVGEEYKLQNETLHLAVNYIDRFLSSMSVLRGKLQLVGTAAMLLASKFEEIYPPEVAEFVYITDDTYTKKQVLRMEHLVLKVLAFDLAAPTVNQFLTQYFLHQQPANYKVESLAMFLGELSLIDADPYLKYLPSVIAGAAFHLALYTVTGQSWPESLVRKTGYTLESLKPCLMDLHQTYLKAPQHAQQSIREKYKNSKYHGVSLLNPPETLNV